MIAGLQSLIRRVFGSPQGGDLWAYWITHAETLRWIVGLMALTVLFLSIGWMSALRKPPVVIRIDDVGKATVIRDLPLNNAPSDLEAVAFVKDFLHAYIEINSLTVQKDLAKALNMMTRRFQSAHLKELKSDNFLEKIVRANIQTDLEIKQTEITSRTPSRIYLDVRGITSTKPLEDESAPPTKKGFVARLTLLGVPRTERTPNGLLIDDYRSQVVPLEETLTVFPKETE